MPGLIERIAMMGVESKELLEGLNGGVIGGLGLTYPPKDLASIITLINSRAPKAYTMLSVEFNHAAAKLVSEQSNLSLTTHEQKPLRQFLRNLETPFDVVSIDSSGLDVSADEIWRFVEGGKEKKEGFGKGAPKDFGVKKLKPGSLLIVNTVDKGCLDLWYKVRAVNEKIYQSRFCGVCKIGIR